MGLRTWGFVAVLISSSLFANPEIQFFTRAGEKIGAPVVMSAPTCRWEKRDLKVFLSQPKEEPGIRLSFRFNDVASLLDNPQISIRVEPGASNEVFLKDNSRVLWGIPDDERTVHPRCRATLSKVEGKKLSVQVKCFDLKDLDGKRATTLNFSLAQEHAILCPLP